MRPRMTPYTVALVATFAAFAPGAIGAQTDTANAPKSAQELATRYASAHARQDTLAIQRLVYWGRAPQSLRASFNSRLAEEVSRPIRSATITPLAPNESMNVTVRGVSYRPTLTPVAHLDITFVPGKNPSGSESSERSVYVVGAHSGRYYIVTRELVQ
jgi:hypothetical protein